MAYLPGAGAIVLAAAQCRMDIIIEEAHGLRLMRFGTRWCQGAMRIADPQHLELEYAVRMFAWLLFHDLDQLPQQHLATLGLGAGALTRFARLLGMHATAVEIDAAVIEACRTHFHITADDERLQVVHADAAVFVADPLHAQAFDVLQVDAYDAAVEKPALDTEAFYADCRRCLRPDGTLAVNLIGRDLDVRASVARIRSGLQPQAVWQFPPTEGGNVTVLAHCGPVPAEEVLAARARTVVRRWSLAAPGWLAMARRSAGVLAAPAGAAPGPATPR